MGMAAAATTAASAAGSWVVNDTGRPSKEIKEMPSEWFFSAAFVAAEITFNV